MNKVFMYISLTLIFIMLLLSIIIYSRIKAYPQIRLVKCIDSINQDSKTIDKEIELCNKLYEVKE